MIVIIALKELRSLFLSPLAWVILAVIQLLLGYLFLEIGLGTYPLRQNGVNGVTDLLIAPMYGDAAIILLLVSPLITMRLISEEKRNKTLNLLLSAPVSITEIILGKYLGILLFFVVMLALISLMPLSLWVSGTALDWGRLLACLLAVMLLLSAFAAIGLYLSTLTEQPTIAGVTTFGALLLLWIIDWAAGSAEYASGLFAWISILNHYDALLQGLFRSDDVIYYLLIDVGFLGLSIRHLDNHRLQA